MLNIIKYSIKHKLKNCAKIYLWRVKPEIIVIAGSTNRRAFRDVIAGENNNEVRVSPDNHNAEIGVPLSILGLKATKRMDWLTLEWKAFFQAFFGKPVKKIILEIAIDRPNDMQYLLKIFTPQIVVITNLEPAYMENFGTLDNISLEYKKLIQKIPTTGLAVLNNDDQRVRNLKQYSKAKVVTFSINDDSDYQAKNITKTTTGQSFELNNQKIELNKFGKHYVLAELANQIIKDAQKNSSIKKQA